MGYPLSKSKSYRAMDAESKGRYPMTRAKKIVAEKTGVTQVKAKQILELIHDGEWHHTSKFYNRVDYYNTRVAIALLKFSDQYSLDPLVLADIQTSWIIWNDDGTLNNTQAETPEEALVLEVEDDYVKKHYPEHYELLLKFYETHNKRYG